MLEIELKLELPSGSDPAPLLAGIPEALPGLDCGRRRLEATYFDTPDRALHRADLSLRIRREGDRLIQTVKRPAGACGGLARREEWERELVAFHPHRDPASPLDEALPGSLDALVPQFRVDCRRSTHRIGPDGLVLQLDEAEVAAGERREAFLEIEIECPPGREAEAFATGRKLARKWPLRLGVKAKAERGHILLGPLPDHHGAQAAALDAATRPPDALATIVMACLRHYRLNETILLDRPSPEAVHQARVALRRLRSAMRTFRPLTGEDEEAARLEEALRCLTLLLGEVRDLDVLLDRAGPGLVRKHLLSARRLAWNGLARALDDPASRVLPLAVAQWALLGDWRQAGQTAAGQAMDLPDLARHLLDRALRRLRRHGRHLTELDAQALHRLRKDAKQLRYAVDCLSPALDDGGRTQAQRRFVKALARLQDELGAINDLAVAQNRLAALGLADTPDAQALLHQWDRKASLKKAARLRHALLDHPPFWR